MQNRDVLISGAGVAGPVLAHWLHRHGFRPTVVERAPGLRTGGYKVDVRGPATEVLRRTGVLGAVRAAATDMRDVSFVRADGRVITTMDADLLMGRRGDDLEIMRTDLTGILYDATRSDVEYVFGDAIATMSGDEHGVDVTFDHGGTRRFGFVVGADGVHSATRGKILTAGTADDPLVHLGAYLCVFAVPNHLGLDRREVFHSAPGRFVNVYSTGPHADAKALLAFRAAPPTHGRGDVAAQKAWVAAHFDTVGWEVPRLLDALRDSDDLYLDALSQVHLPHWTRGRVALVGDAAYCPSPASGQGTSLALVGAYVLAGELAAAHGDHRIGFDRYERVMRPYVDVNLAFGRAMARDMVPGTRAQIRLREVGMRTMRFNPFAGRLMQRMLRPMHEAADAIDLPAYPVAERAG